MREVGQICRSEIEAGFCRRRGLSLAVYVRLQQHDHNSSPKCCIDQMSGPTPIAAAVDPQPSWPVLALSSFRRSEPTPFGQPQPSTWLDLSEQGHSTGLSAPRPPEFPVHLLFVGIWWAVDRRLARPGSRREDVTSRLGRNDNLLNARRTPRIKNKSIPASRSLIALGRLDVVCCCTAKARPTAR